MKEARRLGRFYSAARIRNAWHQGCQAASLFRLGPRQGSKRQKGEKGEKKEKRTKKRGEENREQEINRGCD